MRPRRRNEPPWIHEGQAVAEVKYAAAALASATRALGRGDREGALLDAALASMSMGAAAAHGQSANAEQQHALMRTLSRLAVDLSVVFAALFKAHGLRRRVANPDTPVVMIVAISPSITTSSKWIYLLVDDKGQIADAWVTEAETFPEGATKYKRLPSLDIDVTASQYRTMAKFAKQLKKLRKVAPKLQRERKAANPDLKRRVMR